MADATLKRRIGLGLLTAYGVGVMVGAGIYVLVGAVAAALNGVLAQIVMASRVLFGLGRRSSLLAIFHYAHLRVGTPVLATFLVGAFVLIGSLILPVAALAGATSAIMLAVSVLVNAALIGAKRTQPQAPFRVPMIVPVVGLLASAAAFVMQVGGGG